MIKIYHKKIKEKNLKETDKFIVGSWVRVESPTPEEISFLKEKLSLDEDLIRDAIDPYEAPRLETEGRVVYIFTRAPSREEDGKIVTIPILVAVGDNFVATIVSKKLNFIDVLLDKGGDFSTTQKTKLVLHIFSTINQEYSKFFTEMSKKIRGIYINLENIKNKDIVQFVFFEEILSDFVSALVPTNASLKTILSGKFLDLYKDDKELMEDLLLHNEQLIFTCENNLKNITNIREAYSTIMTNNLNQSIKVLTVVTVLITIPTFITSFYGMNVSLPLQESPLASLYVLGIAFIVSGIILIFFIKRRWL